MMRRAEERSPAWCEIRQPNPLDKMVEAPTSTSARKKKALALGRRFDYLIIFASEALAEAPMITKPLQVCYSRQESTVGKSLGPISRGTLAPCCGRNHRKPTNRGWQSPHLPHATDRL
jgi:hypothetical protein